MKIIRLLFTLSIIAVSSINAKAYVPEFGSSVKFEAGQKKPVLANLKGKSVIIIFCQEWCPKCNKWTKKPLAEIAKLYGKDPRCQVIALRTDGNIGGLKNYLTKRKIDFSNWLLGTDAGGVYEGQLMGKKGGLWLFTTILSDGSSYNGYMGSQRSKGRKKLIWLLISKLNSHGKVEKGFYPLIKNSQMNCSQLSSK